MFWIFILAIQAFAANVDEDLAQSCVLYTFKDPHARRSFCWFLGHSNPLGVDCHKLPEGMCVIYQDTEKNYEPLFDWSKYCGVDLTFPFCKYVNAVVTYKNRVGDCSQPSKLVSTLAPMPKADHNGTTNIIMSYHAYCTTGQNMDTSTHVCGDFYPCSHPAQIEQKFVRFLRKDSEVVCKLPDYNQEYSVIITPISSYETQVFFRGLRESSYTVTFPRDKAGRFPF